MKSFMMLFLALGMLNASSVLAAAPKISCSGVVDGDSKSVSCDQLSGTKKADCLSRKAKALKATQVD